MKHFSDYASWLLGVIDSSGIVRDRSAVARVQKGRMRGWIMAPADGGFAKPGAPAMGLIFLDGAFLRFQEHVVMNRDASISRLSYSYHYQRPDGYYFRYDKLEHPFADPAKHIIEPQRHLHVAQSAPRFPTHSTNLTEVLDLIKWNFYRSSIYR